MQQHEINTLIIDDDKDICVLLKKLLTEDGYNVEISTRPKQALRKIREKTYHVIILDLKMPDINGLDLLTKIKKINSDISVIILTAFPSVDSAVQTLKADAFDYVEKPFNIDKLRKTIKTALRSRLLLIEPEERLNIKTGKRLRELRNGKKLTLKQFAERADLSVSLVSQIERVECAASISTLNKIVTVLNISLEEFFKNI